MLSMVVCMISTKPDRPLEFILRRRFVSNQEEAARQRQHNGPYAEERTAIHVFDIQINYVAAHRYDGHGQDGLQPYAVGFEIYPECFHELEPQNDEQYAGKGRLHRLHEFRNGIYAAQLTDDCGTKHDPKLDDHRQNHCHQQDLSSHQDAFLEPFGRLGSELLYGRRISC